MAAADSPAAALSIQSHLVPPYTGYHGSILLPPCLPYPSVLRRGTAQYHGGRAEHGAWCHGRGQGGISALQPPGRAGCLGPMQEQVCSAVVLQGVGMLHCSGVARRLTPFLPSAVVTEASAAHLRPLLHPSQGWGCPEGPVRTLLLSPSGSAGTHREGYVGLGNLESSPVARCLQAVQPAQPRPGACSRVLPWQPASTRWRGVCCWMRVEQSIDIRLGRHQAPPQQG